MSEHGIQIDEVCFYLDGLAKDHAIQCQDGQRLVKVNRLKSELLRLEPERFQRVVGALEELLRNPESQDARGATSGRGKNGMELFDSVRYSGEPTSVKKVDSV